MVIGIAWYRREDYDRLMAMFPDRKILPDTYDEWLSTAQEVSIKMLLEGFIVEKAILDPKAFPDWCRANGMKMDAEGRTRYATEYAREKRGGLPDLGITQA